jgi:Cu-Zn family superoxide dismutase
MKRVCLMSALSLLLTATAATQPAHEQGGVTRALAVLAPLKGSGVHGVVTFEAVEHGVRVVADITGLAPGKHGFHIHEFGDCSSDDGTSAGGHFNPEGMPHSMPSSDKRHAGDMGNVEAGSDGNAHLEYVDAVMKLSGEHSIVGHAVIVHEKEDDMKTQPTGNAGARVACGVIGIGKGK